jgi:dienelactone hydrolase
MQLKRGLVALLSTLLAAAPASAAPSPATNPAAASQPASPVEHGTAMDRAIDLRGATGDVAKWLKGFDVKPQQFEYSLQTAQDDGFVLACRLTFPSPFVSPWPENNVVPAELYLPRHAAGKVRAAIVLDIMQGNAILARALARGLAEQGVAAMYMPMAYYNQRRPRSDPHMRIFNQDPHSAIDAVRQTVMDIRRAKAILASRPEIDPDHLCITGISLGGIMTSLAAGVDGTFDRVVPILAGGDLPSLIFHAPETRRLREQLKAKGVTPEQLAKDLACIEPLHFASRIDPSRCLMINAAKDEVIPRLATESLARAIGSPMLLWAPAGHITSIFYFPAIRQTVVRFLQGQAVDKIQY